MGGKSRLRSARLESAPSRRLKICSVRVPGRRTIGVELFNDDVVTRVGEELVDSGRKI